jgi:TldD protein
MEKFTQEGKLERMNEKLEEGTGAAEQLLSLCSSSEIRYASATYRGSREFWMSLRNGAPVMLSPQIEYGVSVRVCTDRGIGFASTNSLERSMLKRIVASAISMARAGNGDAPDLRSGTVENATWVVEQKRKMDDTSVEEKIRKIQEIDSAARDCTELRSFRNVSFGEVQTLKYFVDTEGTKVLGRDAKFDLYYMIMLQSGASAEQVSRTFGYTGGEEGLEQLDVLAKTVEYVKGIEGMLLNGKSFKSERLDVLCGSEVTGIACHESCGHPMEADRIMGREAAQAGKSFVQLNSRGQPVGSELVTIVDDPQLPNSFGYYAYDDEGVRARRRTLYNRGRIDEFLQNRESGYRTGMGSNGAGRASSYSLEPLVRMANTFLLPGDYTEEELLSEVNHGLLIKGFNEWNIDDRRYNQKYVGREAYMIENGEISTPVRAPVLEITTPGFWSSVVAVGKKMEFFGGSCGKGDPMQGMEVDMGGPMILLRNVLIK